MQSLKPLLLLLLPFALFACEPKPVSTTFGSGKCGEIPAGVTIEKREFEVAGVTLKEFSMGKFGVKITPEFQKTLSETATNAAAQGVLACRAIELAGVEKNPELVSYFMQLQGFLSDNPSVAHRIEWTEKFPFPKAAAQDQPNLTKIGSAGFTDREIRADIRTIKYEVGSIKPGKAARLNVYYENRGKLDALEVYIVSRMKFIDIGKSLPSAKKAEEALITEIQDEMKSSKDRLTSSVPVGDMRNLLTIRGPIIETSDFYIPKDSDDQEIVREGRFLSMAAIIEYRDRNGFMGVTEFCRHWIKPKVMISCLSGHNGEK